MVNRKVIMQLFRTMSTDDSLFSRMGEYLGRTNIFIAIEKDSTHIPSEALPKYLSRIYKSYSFCSYRNKLKSSYYNSK